MRWANYLLSQIARHFGVSPESLKYWDAFGQLTRYKSGIPKVLIAAGAEQFFRGFLNQACISTHLDWLWPFWVNQQFYPKSHDFVARGLQLYTTNLTHRNWTAIGHPEGLIEPIVDPRGLVTPFANSWSLDFLISYQGVVVAPARLEKINQYLEKNLPVVVTEFSHQELSLKSEAFVGRPADSEMEIIFDRVTIKNNSDHPVNFSFMFSIRPYNPEGISLINRLEYSAFGSFLVNGQLGAVFQESPGLVVCSNIEKGDAVLRINEQVRQTDSFCPAGLATGVLVYYVTLDPGESEFFEARVPVDRVAESVEAVTRIQKINSDELKEQTVQLWHDKLKNAVKIKLPDKNLENAFQANLAFLRLFYDRGQIKPGPFTYHHFWLRDATFMTFALESMGFKEEALAVIYSLLKSQRPDGAFLSEAGEWDSVGQVLWMATQHFRFTGDSEFLTRTYPQLIKAVRWIAANRNVKISQEDILFGLLPPGLSAEHFGYTDYYYWDNYWALAGLRELLETARLTGINSDKDFLEKISWEYGVDLDHSLQKAYSHLGQPALPITPHRGLDSAAIGSLISLYPLKFFSAFDQRIINTVSFLENNCVIDGGFFHDVNHSGFGTYLAMHLAEVYLLQRNPKVWTSINWLMNHATSTFCWPEAIHPVTGGGCMGDGHHGWAIAEFLNLVRNLLFFEEYDRLILTSGIKKEWLENDGPVLKIEQAPSHFGKINFSVHRENGTIVYEFNHHYRLRPREMEINLPSGVEWATGDGQTVTFLGNQVFCSPDVKRLELGLKK